ncbi:hypothetical protein PHYBLDRAFT_170506 [Phycomyces blakesleeanus NRRL 1555(-)]|uniref:Uncharacterized protein n=1 Tax=Phycomyces blakesleeanus (strain ATCC 8743b / DSM 1359 / FGSC 10004 / NBRC 33097 / NRRL 1555) TaxID=763407 RepID=A0A167LUC3_PHYB8|nr:hypothetical protein PHYBLDRAFT_170506 [Phycomyces blakesleeanus NRRL 1555(-)]OAD71118.1 hypothetical protein PHYBLDRAFT_170506 [Phycomyces blakesleeanus NRRL 1555(-)]|eukprot:XP_018289158.1 hypothetical protein PHYBLDRAFT_170506 [Phycomyces blakesleeanus NRRL 1555(-)]
MARINFCRSLPKQKLRFLCELYENKEYDIHSLKNNCVHTIFHVNSCRFTNWLNGGKITGSVTDPHELKIFTDDSQKVLVVYPCYAIAMRGRGSLFNTPLVWF